LKIQVGQSQRPEKTVKCDKAVHRRLPYAKVRIMPPQIAPLKPACDCRHPLAELVRLAVGAVLLVVMVQAFFVLGLVPPVVVAGDSMAPTLPPGERMWIDRTAYWWRAPARGDVVVLPCPTRPSERCVKRVVGLPGESVQIIDGQLLINGQPKRLAMIDQLGPKPGLQFGTSPEYQLADNELFLLGDNAATSQDSRTWEPPGVRRDRLLGRVLGAPPK